MCHLSHLKAWNYNISRKLVTYAKWNHETHFSFVFPSTLHDLLCKYECLKQNFQKETEKKTRRKPLKTPHTFLIIKKKKTRRSEKKKQFRVNEMKKKLCL